MPGTIVSIAAAIPWGTLIEHAPKAFEKATSVYDGISKTLKERSSRQRAIGSKKLTQAEIIESLETDISNLSSELMSLSELAKSTSEVNQGLLAQVSRNKNLLTVSLTLNAVCIIGILAIAILTL